MRFFYYLGDSVAVEMAPPETRPRSFISVKSRTKIVDVKCAVVSSSQLASKYSLQVDAAKKYILCETPNSFAYAPHEGSALFSDKSAIHNFRHEALLFEETFRRQTKQQFIEAFCSPEADFEKVLEVIRKYIFSSHYSLWLYNHHTEYFTLFASSFKMQINYFHKNSDPLNLSKMVELTKEYTTLMYKPNEWEPTLSAMTSVNRLRVCVKDDATAGSKGKLLGILSFYSEVPSFTIRDATVKHIQSIVSMKMSQNYIHYVDSANLLLSKLSEGYKPGNITEYLDSCAADICNIVGFEASSIFLYNNEKRALTLGGIHQAGADSKVGVVPEYDLGQKSKTSSVFKNGKIGFSYELLNDPENSHTFDERTASAPTNWLGIPIKNHKRDVIGVLRAKNKTGNCGNIVNFIKYDVDVLIQVANILGYLYSNELRFQEDQKEKEAEIKRQRTQYTQLQNFLRTYRHEVKSPLIVVTQAKSRYYEIENIDQPDNKDVKKKIYELFNDIDAVGERLSFVANVLTFDAQELVRDTGECNVFKDIITPVASFISLWAKKRRKFLDIDKDSFIELGVVQGDKNTIQMVVNILLDNAIKYSERGARITLYGKADGQRKQIVVESSSFPIPEEERSEIFEQFKRGKEAVRRKIEGAGIGLYLAREVMRVQGGDVVLSNLAAPVRFQILLPK